MTLIDSIPLPNIDPSERARRLAQAGNDWAERIENDPTSAQLTYRVQGRSEGSVATRIAAGRHEFLVDEPTALAGDDVAASPVEFALGALISCQIVVYRLYSNALGIPFDEVSVQAEGDLDARRLFGITDNVRAGFAAVRLTVTVTGPETEEKYRELGKIVDAHCPIFDLFTNPTPVAVTIEKG